MLGDANHRTQAMTFPSRDFAEPPRHYKMKLSVRYCREGQFLKLTYLT